MLKLFMKNILGLDAKYANMQPLTIVPSKNMLYLGILNPNHQNVVYASTNLANIKKHEAAVHDKKKSFQCRHCPHSAFAKGHLQQYVIILKKPLNQYFQPKISSTFIYQLQIKKFMKEKCNIRYFSANSNQNTTTYRSLSIRTLKDTL